jgi:hypothetical protein
MVQPFVESQCSPGLLSSEQVFVKLQVAPLSLRQVVGVLVLKDVFDLTDEQALEELEWNTAWHYALDVLRVRGRPRVTLAVHLKVLALNVKRYVGHLAQAAAAAFDPTLTCAC